MNLQLMNEKEHLSLHKKGNNHSQKTKEKISKARNTSGYLNVYKQKNKSSKQGFVWTYMYSEKNKRKSISSKNLSELEAKVKAKNLPWKKF